MATATRIRHIVNASTSAPPVWVAVGKEKVCCVSGRPESGGPICLVYFIAGDGRDVIPPVDVRPLVPDFEDVAFAAPFVSDFDGHLKCFVSYKPIMGGNDRALMVLDTGLVAEVTR